MDYLSKTPMKTPMKSEFAPYPYDDEIDLREMFGVLWLGRWIIGGITAAAAAVAVAVALLLPNIYTSSALLAPADGGSDAMGGLMEKFGGLASLAGVSLPGADGSKTALAIELVKSRAFLGDFIETHDVLPDLMAVKGWNLKSGEIVYDKDLYDATTKTWVRDVDLPQRPKPSVQEAHEEFLKIINVIDDAETGFITLEIQHPSPIIAQQWVTWLVDDINRTVREQDVAEAERSIEYLKEQATNTALADLQAVFFELIQSQTETMMLAQVRPEYVFKTIDPAVVPEEKSKPKRALICVLGTLLGGMLGVLVVLVRHYALKGDESDAATV